MDYRESLYLVCLIFFFCFFIWRPYQVGRPFFPLVQPLLRPFHVPFRSEEILFLLLHSYTDLCDCGARFPFFFLLFFSGSHCWEEVPFGRCFHIHKDSLIDFLFSKRFFVLSPPRCWFLAKTVDSSLRGTLDESSLTVLWRFNAMLSRIV